MRRRPPRSETSRVLPDAVTRLSLGGIDAFSHAILTTDVGPKVTQATFTLGAAWTHRRRGKGAGDSPNMATMLVFVMTDAALMPAPPETRALTSAVDKAQTPFPSTAIRRRMTTSRHEPPENSATPRASTPRLSSARSPPFCRDLAL